MKYNNKMQYLIKYALFLIVLVIDTLNVGAQSITLVADINSPSNFDNTINITNQPEWINCDVYNDPFMNTHYAMSAIAWDEPAGSSSSVKVNIHDHITGFNRTLTINDARHPDVVIMDVDEGMNTAAPGFAVIAVVYENINTNEINFDFWDVGGFMGYGAGGVSPNHGPWVITSGNSNPCMYPHIDAFPGDPDPANKPYLSTAPSNPYTPLNHFVITWTEDNSGTNEIYAEDGRFMYVSSFADPVFSNNVTYIDDGEMSDIAGVRLLSSTGTNAGRNAHIIYKQGNTDVVEADYDIDLGTISINSLETSNFIGLPRIDAPNTRNVLNSPAYGFFWMGALQMSDSWGHRYVHIYDNVNGATNIESHLLDPTSTNLYIYEMHSPTVSAGQGFHAPIIASGCGVMDYQLGMLIDEGISGGSYYKHASSRISIDGTTIDGVNDINSNMLNGTINNVLATSVAPNIGVSHMAAWNNLVSSQSQIVWKLTDACSGGGFEYKPSPSIVESLTSKAIVIGPNPASSFLNVQNVRSTLDYTITDVTGRVLQTGTVSEIITKIDMDGIASGIYIINFKQGNQQFKIIKQ